MTRAEPEAEFELAAEPTREAASPPRVSIVIPTMAVPERAALLRRAIASVHDQRSRDLDVEIVVVVNGSRFDPAVVRELASDRRIRLEQVAEGSAPGARLHGRRVLTGDYFGFLDDDDELLAGSLDARLAPLRAAPDVAFTVCDGYTTAGERMWDGLNADTMAREPLASLLERNWVASCAPLFRTRSMAVEAFAGLPHTMEWTILAFEIFAARYPFRLVAAPGYRLHDTPVSLSKCDDFPVATVAAVRRMLAHEAAEPLRGQLREKLANALHLVSEQELSRGRPWRALAWHVRSLLEGRGLRFTAYTRHVVAAIFMRGLRS